MGKSKASHRVGRNGRNDIMEIWRTPKQHWTVQIISALVRWRAEIFCFSALIAVMAWVNAQTNTVVMWLSIGGVFAMVFTIGSSRRFVLARMWCVLDRHRLRSCLRNSKIRTMNLDGALPFMLWARPTKTGERVWLWIRVGASGDDIEDALSYIAPACLARSTQLYRPKKVSTVVAVEVIRRDPLERREPLSSPLVKLGAMMSGKSASDSTHTIAASDTAAMLRRPQPTASGESVAGAEPAPTRNGGKSSGKQTPKPQPQEPAVVVNGEDLSDYID